MSDSESQSSTNKKYRYAVVWFQSEKTTELVPLSWIHNEEGQDFCYYPPKKDYKRIDEWLAACAKPDANWESFIAEILSRTRSLEKGKERLERSYKTKEIESTDSEVSSQGKPVVLSGKSLKKILQDVPSMITAQSATCNQDVGPKNDGVIEEHNNPADSRATNQIARQHCSRGITEEYLDEKLRELVTSINSSMMSMKRSLLYDIEKKTSEIKNTLVVGNINNPRGPVLTCSDAIAGIGVALPINSLDDFIKFDESLKEDEEKPKALISLYRFLVCGQSEVKDCISKIMVATITQTVETHYSGAGRKLKNVGKKNFSATATYGCLKDVLVQKFGDTSDMKNLTGKVGKWLSGASDRNGGRANRQKSDLDDRDSINAAPRNNDNPE